MYIGKGLGESIYAGCFCQQFSACTSSKNIVILNLRRTTTVITVIILQWPVLKRNRPFKSVPYLRKKSTAEKGLGKCSSNASCLLYVINPHIRRDGETSKQVT